MEETPAVEELSVETPEVAVAEDSDVLPEPAVEEELPETVEENIDEAVEEASDPTEE